MWFAMWVGLVGCSDDADDKKDDASAQNATVVNVQSIAKGRVADLLATSAVVEAARTADLTPVSPGIVLSLHADDGDTVKRGDLLAVLDSVSLQAGATRSRAEVGRLQKQVADMEKLASQGAVSTRELDDLRYQLDTARTNAGEATRNFGQTRITAPFDGIVARRDARVGELASGRVFQIVDLTDLDVRVDLPERDAGKVQPGQPVFLTSAYDEEVKGTGEVARVSPVIDQNTGTFRVTVVVGDDQPLRPGQFVKVQVQVDERTDVVVVPRKALLYEDGRPYVFLMGSKADLPPEPLPTDPPDEEADKDDRKDEYTGSVAIRRTVKTGLIDDKNAEILEGVVPGDQVVVVGQSNLKEGAHIRTPTDNAIAVPVEPTPAPAPEPEE